MEYGYLAKIYDQLMKEVDYKEWASFIEKCIKKNNSTKRNKLLELACGTGNVTIPLAKKGYEITAMDRSIEMLSQAQQKAMESNLHLKFYQQDMLNLEIDEDFDTILCLCDGINYILDPEDLKVFFQKVYSLLKERGVFIFDISTFYKLKYILGENTYGEDLGDIIYLWENYFCEEEETVEMDLTFFQLSKEGLYEKHKEFHVQKAYHREVLDSLLKKTGFSTVDMYHELRDSPPRENSQRIFFVCQKLG
ncbi:class I SAM-dependent DNA methyltransferase [Isachenkonia alkalipeptolytica]|uniref:Class I SAM-dependent methyltransferase n=1 Tax=Isachenkonia alkalipeptolytica TaxID=2565777 RepID=A0AA44BEZ9_9CLOT|nr:class I SAM-dependent methyltransferase [Isachenkonia alkalipeptolytica]NBG89488.1 class I SAM-dependent methyltransferase [Isachenkonia alkalipeptolytica]